MDTLIPANGYPGPAFTCFQTLFTKLSQAQYTIPDNIQAMIILSYLPATMSVITQLLAQTKDALGNVITSTLDQIITAPPLTGNSTPIWAQLHHQKESLANLPIKLVW